MDAQRGAAESAPQVAAESETQAQHAPPDEPFVAGFEEAVAAEAETQSAPQAPMESAAEQAAESETQSALPPFTVNFAIGADYPPGNIQRELVLHMDGRRAVALRRLFDALHGKTLREGAPVRRLEDVILLLLDQVPDIADSSAG